MWQTVTESDPGTYEGAKFSLEAAVHCTKEDFAEQLRQGQTDEIRVGMIATVYDIERFLLMAEKERRRLMEQISILRRQRNARHKRARTDRFQDN
jgi:hypothetical protein